MKFAIKIDPNARKAEIHMKSLVKLTEKGIRSAFYKLGKDLKSTATKLILKKPRSGRVYLSRKSGRLRRHIASRPGEAPANMTGALKKSLDFEMQGADRLRFGYREGSPQNKSTGSAPSGGVIYGKWLEEGTRKMKARPGLRLSVEANQANALEHFNTELEKQLAKK